MTTPQLTLPPPPTDPQFFKGPSVMFCCPITAQAADTEGKYLILAAQIAQSYPLTVLLWDEECRKAAESLSLPYLFLSLSTYQVNRVTAARRFINLLPHTLTTNPASPSWGSLLGYDDFVGLAQGHTIRGNDISRPSIFLHPIPGSENNSPEDEQTYAALYHWTLTNKIPTIGIEVQNLKSPHRIQRFPDTLTLVKNREDANYTTSFPLSPLARYLCSHSREQAPENAVLHEQQLRASLNWTPGTYYLLLPYHTYYIQECVAALQALSKVWPDLHAAGFQLLITCGSAHRRSLSEKDIILHALSRYLSNIPFQIIENGVITHIAPLCEAILLPYHHSMSALFTQWGIPFYTPKTTYKLKDLRLTIRPQEAIAYVLSSPPEKEPTDALQEELNTVEQQIREKERLLANLQRTYK